YEMLTGRPPFRAATIMDTLMLVATEDPVPPSRFHPRLPADLERICLKCLEKSPARRYESAVALAEDLRRHLRGEPVQARPQGKAERLWRWCRKNPLPASLLVAVTLSAVSGMWYLSRLSEDLVQATALEGAAQQAEMLSEANDFYAFLVKRIAKKV